MNCDNIKRLFPEYLKSELDAIVKAQVNSHLSTCKKCAIEFGYVKKIWLNMELLPDDEPSPQLSQRFYSMLASYKQGLKDSKEKNLLWEKINGWLSHLWQPAPVFQFAIIIICLTIGFSFGYFTKSSMRANGEIADLRGEISEMKQIVSVSLLNQASPSERLRGVHWSQSIQQPNESLVTALLNTLTTDPNVNVRLAAVDALYLFSNDSYIRTALINALAAEKSPMVQISLIRLLVEIKERKSLEALQQLINDEQINQAVKKQAQWGIEQLS